MWEEVKEMPTVMKVGAIFVFAMLLAMVFAWFTPEPTPAPDTFIRSNPIGRVEDLKKEDIKLAKAIVKALPKDKIKKKIKLPPEIIEDPVKEITATADIPKAPNGAEVVAVIDTGTGDTTLHYQLKPAPFFEFKNDKRIGVGYGVGSSGSTLKVYGEYTFMRVGAFHVGAQAEANVSSFKEPEAKAMAVIDYRW